MNKFIKNFDTFIKEDLDITTGDELPQEIQSSVKSILDNNFDQAWRKRFVGDTIRFRVTDTDFKLEPEETLEMDLVQGASKKRKYDVILHFVDKVEAGEKEQKNGIGGDLIYKIEYMPKKSKPIKLQDEDDVTKDFYETPDEEPELVEDPDEESSGRGRKKGKFNVRDLDPVYRTGGLSDDDFDDDEPIFVPKKPSINPSISKIKEKPIEIPKEKPMEISNPKSKSEENSNLKNILIQKLSTKNLSKRDINVLLLDKMPDTYTDRQKSDKIGNIIDDLGRKKGIMKNIGTLRFPVWTLVRKED